MKILLRRFLFETKFGSLILICIERAFGVVIVCDDHQLYP
jgi:hypothetical protein